MAEAEDVLQDVARHATMYARSLWLRHRGPDNKPRPIVLAQVAERLDLLVSAAFSRGHALRIAQPSAPSTMLLRLFRRHDVHGAAGCGVPATDGHSIWLPNDVGVADMPTAIARYRAMALQQAMRCARGSASVVAQTISATRLEPLIKAIYLLLEAQAADMELLQRLPGAAGDIAALRSWVLEGCQSRPPSLPPACQAVQELKLAVLTTDAGQAASELPF